MRPSAPSFRLFIISILIAGLVYAAFFGVLDLVFVVNYKFEFLSLAYFVLLLGTIFRRL